MAEVGWDVRKRAHVEVEEKELEEEEERVLREGVGRMSSSVKMLIASKIKEADCIGRYLKVGISRRGYDEEVGEQEQEQERLVSQEYQRSSEDDSAGGYGKLARALYLTGGAGELDKALASKQVVLKDHLLSMDVHQLMTRDRVWLESSLLYMQLMVAWGLVDEVAFDTFKIEGSSLIYYGHNCYGEAVERVPFPLFKKHFLPALASSFTLAGNSRKRVKLSFESAFDRDRAEEEHITFSPWMYNGLD